VNKLIFPGPGWQTPGFDAPAPATSRETKGRPDALPPPQNLAEAILEACARSDRAPLDEDVEQCIADIADSLDDCLAGSTLDLRFFGETLGPTLLTITDLEVLPPDAWVALEEHVQQKRGRGITSVHLPAMTPGLARGLAALPDLKHVLVDGRTVWSSNPAPTSGSVVHQPSFAPLNLNGKASLTGTSSFLHAPGTKATCQTLGMLWIVKDHQQTLKKEQSASPTAPDGETDTKKSAGPVTAFYDAFRTPEAITAAITQDIAQEECRMFLESRAEALFDCKNFTAMLAQSMGDLQAGEKRWYMVGTPTHALPLRIGRHEPDGQSAGQEEYVATLYDANDTDTDCQVTGRDAQSFASKDLSNWLTPRRQALYFPSDPKIGSLTRWFPPEQRTDGKDRQDDKGIEHKGPRVHVGESSIASASFLYAAMDTHAPEWVARCMAAIFKSDLCLDDQVEALRGADSSGDSALAWAILRNQPANVAGYVRAVVTANDKALPLAHKLALLGAANTASMLLRIVRAHADMPVEAGIRHYVREIAASALPLKHKLALLAGKAWDSDLAPTAAEEALAGTPSRAMAMICGIHDARQSAEDTAAMLDALEISTEELDRAVEKQSGQLGDSGLPMDLANRERLKHWTDELSKASPCGPFPHETDL